MLKKLFGYELGLSSKQMPYGFSDRRFDLYQSSPYPGEFSNIVFNAWFHVWES